MDIKIIILFIVAAVIMYYYFTKNSFTNISRFSPLDVIPGAYTASGEVNPSNSYYTDISSGNTGDVYSLDTRYYYPYTPPVNPMATQSVLVNQIKASPGLFYTQTATAQNALLDSNTNESTNELLYSGGDTQLLQIPLQYNVPYQPEILRSQPILITPYNRIKYSTGPASKDVFL
jgi:hypothetical protein